MTTKLMTLAAALALGSSLFADPCKCGKPECKCGDECRCTAETCKCGCGTDKDVLAEEEDDAFVSAEFGLAFDSKYLTYGVVDGKTVTKHHSYSKIRTAAGDAEIYALARAIDSLTEPTTDAVHAVRVSALSDNA